MTWPDRLMFVGSSFVLSVVIKTTAILAIAFVAQGLCRRCPASLRHIIYVGAFVVLLILPFASLALPPIPMSARANGLLTSWKQLAPDGLPELATTPDVTNAIDDPRSAASPRTPWQNISLQHALMGMWLVGTVVCLVPILSGTVRGARLRRRSAAWTPGQRLLDDLAAARRIRRSVRVLHAAEANGFFSLGWLRPVILVPSDAAGWPTDALTRALVHELEHVRRFDYATLLLSRFVRALYWFHPLVWFASRRLELEAEFACDDAVVSADDAVEYARLLVTAAQRSIAGAPPLLGIASRRELSNRIHAVLDPGRRRERLGRRSAASAIAIAVATAFVVAPRMTQKLEALSPAPIAITQISESPTVPVVASIKPSADNGPGMVIRRTPPGTYSAVKATTMALITTAFSVTADRVIGAPTQIRRFDIEARYTGEHGNTPPTTAAVLQSVLHDRFGLVAHVEQRELPAYLLKFARSDRRLGDGLVQSAVNCADPAAAAVALNADRPAGNGAPACGAIEEPGRFVASGVTIQTLARALRIPAGRPVVDATGLQGTWDVVLEFASLPEHAPDRVSVFTAVKERLGLELVPGTTRLDVLVVDAIHDPTPNDASSPARPSFDAASIKSSRALRPRVVVQGGGYTATGMSLRDLMKAVFLVHPTQLIGGPDWIDSARFDIRARTQSPPPGNVVGVKPLVRSLLEDRFDLRTHMEMRELDTLVMVRARPDAPLLPGLQPSQSMCEGTDEERRARRRDGWPPCEAMQIVNVPGAGTRGETTRMKVSGYTMDQFAGYVGAILDSPAVNLTRMPGRFDFEFSYVRPLPDASAGEPLPEGPRLAQAVEEQLGLRVERRRVSVPVVVIDVVTMPSPD